MWKTERVNSFTWRIQVKMISSVCVSSSRTLTETKLCLYPESRTSVYELKEIWWDPFFCFSLSPFFFREILEKSFFIWHYSVLDLYLDNYVFKRMSPLTPAGGQSVKLGSSTRGPGAWGSCAVPVPRYQRFTGFALNMAEHNVCTTLMWQTENLFYTICSDSA